MKRLRTFIAIDLPLEVKEKIALLVGSLEKKLPKGVKAKWINPTHAHITLVFLGHIAEDRVHSATACLAKAVLETNKCEVKTGGLSYFSSDKKTGEPVIFLDLQDPEKRLKELFRTLTDNLCREDFYPPTRFYPHVTLGHLEKINRDQNKEGVLSNLIDTPVFAPAQILVERVGIYESLQEGKEGKRRYRLIRSFNLR